MTTAEQRQRLQRWRDAENICRPCTKPEKAAATLNHDNPLSCGCHCESVANLLARVIQLDVEIRRLQGQ
ncbi:hypothetical protein [Sulfuriflexus sp.]|uniref:hypothetical protein n=1 Tax=Sulfuriflexus sp. TaxID=2015443 RepID=UPI0028CCBB0F|nr:hypothetical protein [Sulfuriflexus sp.]MDT8403738.1 hypothetical protein [Sulfuriflexus sp.]